MYFRPFITRLSLTLIVLALNACGASSSSHMQEKTYSCENTRGPAASSVCVTSIPTKFTGDLITATVAPTQDIFRNKVMLAKHDARAYLINGGEVSEILRNAFAALKNDMPEQVALRLQNAADREGNNRALALMVIEVSRGNDQVDANNAELDL